MTPIDDAQEPSANPPSNDAGNASRPLPARPDADQTEKSVEDANSAASRDQAPEANVPRSAAQSDSAEAVDIPKVGEANADDDLPEWEPLTPELVEDEAIRGDFGLRCAVCLLAMLLGFTKIADTETLVHVKTGQYIAANGWLPPGHDVFSYTAADRPWINLAWLFDLMLAGVHGLTGVGGLCVFKSLIAGATFGLIVTISRPNVSTWWGSICAALAVLVCYPQFTATPELITLLGLAWTLWLLCRWRQKISERQIWLLVPTFVLWSNLDERMFLGLALLALYAVGEAVGHFLDFPGIEERHRRGQLWLVIAACFGAALVNPFGWHSLTAAENLYAVVYPALKQHYSQPTISQLQFYSVFDEAFWQQLSVHGIAAFLLFVATVVTFALNWSRLDAGEIFMFLGFASLAVATVHELAAASIVSCVIVTLNAQDWYRARFRQTYSVETSELLFSRGGRALTVLAFFAVALLGVSGRLQGRDGSHVGIGMDARLASTVNGFRQTLDDSYDNRPFNFVMFQGDALIWIGQKVFVDSRVALYHGDGADDLLKLHDQTRQAIRLRRAKVAGTGDTDLWKRVFDRYRVTHVLPRLSGPNADYYTYFDLLHSPAWLLTAQGATTAVFYRQDTDDQRLHSYLKKHAMDFTAKAFRHEFDYRPRTFWPQPPSRLDWIFSPSRSTHSDAIQEARHYMQMLVTAQVSWRVQASLAHLAIRNANRALLDDPNRADAYRILGAAYDLLGVLETQLVNSMGVGNRFLNWIRYYQSIDAYNQSLIVEPDHADTLLKLSEIYSDAGRWDLALKDLSAYQRLRGTAANLGNQPPSDADKKLIKKRQQLEEAVAKGMENVDEALKAGTNRLRVAQLAFESGCVLRAVELLEADSKFLESNPSAQLLMAASLMEAGQSERAYELTLQLEGVATAMSVPNWRKYAALASLAIANYDRAIKLWKDEIKEMEAQRIQAIFYTLPLIQPPAIFSTPERNLWPVTQTLAAQEFLYRYPEDIAGLLLSMAMCQLEKGDFSEATESIDDMLAKAPESGLRPLARFYLFELTGKLVDFEPPSDWIPIFRDMFAPEPDDAAAQTN